MSAYVGGVLGNVTATGPNKIYNSSNSGDIITVFSNGGGIAGYFHHATHINSIVNSRNTGEVRLAATSPTQTAAASYAGGITGQGGMISASSNTGDITLTARYEWESRYYNGYAGGISGSANVPASALSCISESYNTGSVSISYVTGFSEGFIANIGGIAGQQETDCSISNNYNTGNIDATTNGRQIYAGGIVGYRNNRYGNPEVSGNAAANSSVTGATTHSTNRLNRIVGYAYTPADVSAITGNIALDEMTKVGGDNIFDETEIAYSGTGKTATELKTQATYGALGWLFGSDADYPWTMPSPDGTDYPRLYWE
jgi:hypothetical protein